MPNEKYVPNDHNPNYDNFGKGHWNRRRNAEKYDVAAEKLKANAESCSCRGTGYIHRDEEDVPCPDCKPHIKKVVAKPGVTRFTYG